MSKKITDLTPAATRMVSGDLIESSIQVSPGVYQSEQVDFDFMKPEYSDNEIVYGDTLNGSDSSPDYTFDASVGLLTLTGEQQIYGTGNSNTTYGLQVFNSDNDRTFFVRDDRTSGFEGQVIYYGGVTGANPTPRIKLDDYLDNSGNPSVSHIDLYQGMEGFGVSTSSLNYFSNSAHTFYAANTTTIRFTIQAGYNYTPNTIMIGADSFTPGNGRLFVYGGYSSFGGSNNPSAMVFVRGEDNANTTYSAKFGNSSDVFGLQVRNDGYNIKAAVDGAIADGGLSASQYSTYINEAGNLFIIKVKYADGATVKTVSLPLI